MLHSPLPPQAVLGINVAASFAVWGLLWATYAWPVVRRWDRIVALRALLGLHCFRFIGLGFLVPGVVSPALSPAFAVPAAFGDLGAAALALLALLTIRRPAGVAFAWAFTLWGSADLLRAFYVGNRSGLIAGQLGTMYFVVTLIVPLLLITHGLIATLLLQRAAPVQAHASG
jgi:hypothetical protein